MSTNPVDKCSRAAARDALTQLLDELAEAIAEKAPVDQVVAGIAFYLGAHHGIDGLHEHMLLSLLNMEQKRPGGISSTTVGMIQDFLTRAGELESSTIATAAKSDQRVLYVRATDIRYRLRLLTIDAGTRLYERPQTLIHAREELAVFIDSLGRIDE